MNRQFSEIRPILAINSVIDGKAFSALSVVRYSASLTCAVALALPKYVLAKFYCQFQHFKDRCLNYRRIDDKKILETSPRFGGR